MEFTDQNFQKEVLESKVPVLVDFWAPWCGPCRAEGPIIETLEKEYAGRIKIGKMNVDESERTPQKFGVMSIPTLIIFSAEGGSASGGKGGKIVEQMVGVQSKEILRKKLDALLK